MTNLVGQLPLWSKEGVDWFIPAKLLHAPSRRGLARVFVLTHFGGAAIAALTALHLRQFASSAQLAVYFVFGLAVLFGCLPFILKRTGSMALVTLTSFQFLTITSLLGTYEYGGFGSPFLPWLLVSLMSGLFYQPRQTRLVITLFTVDVAIFFAFLVWGGQEPENLTLDLSSMGWMSIALAMMYMAVMALYYARVQASRSELQLEAERHQAMTDDLERARANAEQLSRNRSLFFSKMSHELRTPLNAIIGYSEILLEDFEEKGLAAERQVLDLRRINSTGSHLLSLLSEVLYTETLESGHGAVDVSTFTLGELRDDVLATVQPLIQKQGNRLVLDCPLAQDRVTTDAKKLRQMLINLLSNAAKFTSNGTITLELWVERGQSDDRLHASVLDTGIGIAPTAMPKLFENYVQADSTISERFGGTGIGLALTRKLAALLGGTVSVTSQEGRGSTFTIDIPAVTNVSEFDSALSMGTQ